MNHSIYSDTSSSLFHHHNTQSPFSFYALDSVPAPQPGRNASSGSIPQRENNTQPHLQADPQGLFVSSNGQGQAFVSWGDLQNFLSDPVHMRHLPRDHPLVRLGIILREQSNEYSKQNLPPFSLGLSHPAPVHSHTPNARSSPPSNAWSLSNPGGRHSPPQNDSGFSNNSNSNNNRGVSPTGSRRSESPVDREPPQSTMPEVKTRQASEDLVVFWDESCARPAPPDSFGSPGENGEEERRGEKIVFPKDGYVRVWVEDSEQFPGTGKGPGNFWLRGQCLNLRECICGFKFVARNSVDPFKRPSIVRAHLANCSRRGENDPLKRLCALYVKGEVGVRKKSKVPRRRSEARFSAYPPTNPNRTNPPSNPLASLSEGSRFTEL